MEIKVEQLLKGKPTRIKNKAYFGTAQYVEPFLEKMSKFTDDFRVEVQVPDQVTRTVTGDINTDDITYNRVLIQAVMPEEYAWDNHDEVIGFLYGLDTRKPVVKLYRGGLNRACTNLCVFSPTFLHAQELEPEKAINYKPVVELMEQTNDIKAWINNLKETYWDRDDELIDRNLGNWIRKALHCKYQSLNGPVKIGVPLIMDAYKLLFEKDDSDYYIKENEDVNMFKVYNAFTELITNDNGKDIINKVEKTLLLRELLNF